MATVGIVNYGMGNISSVKNALNYIGYTAEIINSPLELKSVSKIILPGVGAFGMAMDNLNRTGFTEALGFSVFSEKKMILGLCLGMQLFFNKSAEHGKHKGLGWIQGEVRDLRAEVDSLPIPHMGWNSLIKKNNPLLLNNISDLSNDFYFVHSFYCRCQNDIDSCATLNYGVSMDVMVQKNNIFGCQFHPEKSQKNGLVLLENFCKL